MSLHLGNLSPHIRKDELERVFQRFGQCTVRLKDGYGFAVFDSRGRAEKALRALKGRKICGQLIHLSWSNRQPKPLGSLSRAHKSRDMQYGRISGRVDNNICRNFFGSHRDYTVSNKQPDNGGVRHRTVVICDHRGRFNHNDEELEHFHHKEEFLDEDSYIQPNHVDNGRWGDQVDNPQVDNRDAEEGGFDRYEPDCVDDREAYENSSLGNTEGSPSREKLIDKSNRVHHADSVRGHCTCFKCGAAGHKMHDCPLKDALHGKSLHCSGHRHDIETNSRCREQGGVEGPESRPRGRLQPINRNSRSPRRDEVNGKPSHSARDGANGRSSPVGNACNRTKTKDYNRKRQRERDDQIAEMLDDKKSKSLASSHLHYDNASPHLGTHSKSVRASPDSILRSRSVSPVHYSPSASSRSKTRSNRSGFISIKSKSRSGSSSLLSSLSISHGGSLPSSPNKEEKDLNASYVSVPNHQVKEKLTDVCKEHEPGTADEKTSTDTKADAGLGGYIENSSCQLEEDLIERQQLELDLKDENATSVNSANVSWNGSLGDQMPQFQEVLPERQQLEYESRKNSLQIGDVPGRNDGLANALEVQDDRKMDQSHDGNSGSTIVPLVSCEVKISCPSSVEQGHSNTAGGQPSAEKLTLVELENGNCVKSLEPVYESALNGPFKACVGSHMSISAEELCTVLKHYGLKHPEEDEQKLGAQDYFGSARLWPWALIYYRRLKKGPVSAENYARRIAQNKEFGIIDKCIRSSSGWGESIEHQ